MSRIHTVAEPSKAFDALAGQIDRLTRRQAETDRAITTVQTVVGDIAAALADLRKSVTPKPRSACAPVEWLTVEDPEIAAVALIDLDTWVRSVWSHYGNPPMGCWPYHPAVVAELLATRAVWIAATEDGARPPALAEWHERHRESCAKRVASYMRCESAAGGHKYAPPGQRPSAWRIRDLNLTHIATWWALTHATTDDPPPGLETFR